MMTFDFSGLSDEDFGRAVEAVWQESLHRFEIMMASGQIIRNERDDVDDE